MIKLINVLDNLDLVILNDSIPTRICPQRTPSAVDLFIISPRFLDAFSWEVVSDTLGSDHFLIFIQLQIDPVTFFIKTSTK